MSLSQKYTWKDFLKTHPELKAKKIKRTSPEGEKAFQAAFKTFAKNFLKDRQEQLKKEEARVSKEKKELVTKLKAVDGKKWHLKAKKLNEQIGRMDTYLARLTKAQTKAKELTKGI